VLRNSIVPLVAYYYYRSTFSGTFHGVVLPLIPAACHHFLPAASIPAALVDYFYSVPALRFLRTLPLVSIVAIHRHPCHRFDFHFRFLNSMDFLPPFDPAQSSSPLHGLPDGIFDPFLSFVQPSEQLPEHSSLVPWLIQIVLDFRG
jgi:hypothetical protein